MQLNYGTASIDVNALPETSIAALLRRGLSHLLGNEQSSRVNAWTEAQTKANNGTAPSDEEKAAKKAEFQKDAIQALLDGTLGTRTSGPKADPIEAEMAKLAKAAVVSILANQVGADGKKLRFPKEGETITFANGMTRTGEAMVANQLAKNGEALRKQAEKNIKARESAAKAVAEKVKTASNLEDLGV